MLCDKLIAEENIHCAEPDAGFTWVEGERIREVPPSTAFSL
jgi:hypothetical protein